MRIAKLTSLTRELEEAMPVFKSLQSISSCFSPPPTLYPKKFSHAYICFHVSEESTGGRKGEREEKKKGERKEDGSRMTCRIEMHHIKCEKERKWCEFLGTAGGNLFGKKFSIPSGFKVHIICDPSVAVLGTESQNILAHTQQNT